ncbi:MAG: DUF4124 domain-containing protein [Desulfobacter sp.]|nr:DUF4124 domain-containing protein [Desulfobacter sp.]WDP84465.1 MAG: DUF4124 domain-containing protein [Desulfobacter sp.]
MKKSLFSLLILVLALCFADLAMAGMYTWKDKNGVTHISDAPPTAEQGKVKITHPDISPKPDPRVRVEIFTTSW